jgi:hypothetical protein
MSSFQRGVIDAMNVDPRYLEVRNVLVFDEFAILPACPAVEVQDQFYLPFSCELAARRQPALTPSCRPLS